MSNLLGHDTFNFQILFIFSLFADSVEMINPWKFQPSTLMVPMLLKFEIDQNGCFAGCSDIKINIVAMVHAKGKFFYFLAFFPTLKREANFFLK